MPQTPFSSLTVITTYLLKEEVKTFDRFCSCFGERHVEPRNERSQRSDCKNDGKV